MTSPTCSERQDTKRSSISIAWWWPPLEPRLRIERRVESRFSM